MRDEGGSDVPAEIEEDYVENNSQLENGDNGTQSERSSQGEVQDEVGEDMNRELYEEEEHEAEGDYEKDESAQEEEY